MLLRLKQGGLAHLVCAVTLGLCCTPGVWHPGAEALYALALCCSEFAAGRASPTDQPHTSLSLSMEAATAVLATAAASPTCLWHHGTKETSLSGTDIRCRSPRATLQCGGAHCFGAVAPRVRCRACISHRSASQFSASFAGGSHCGAGRCRSLPQSTSAPQARKGHRIAVII